MAADPVLTKVQAVIIYSQVFSLNWLFLQISCLPNNNRSDEQKDTLISLLSNEGQIGVNRGSWRENY